MQLNVSGSDQWPKYIRSLVVGQPGVGKTTFAAGFENPIFANTACGLTTLARIGNVPFVNILLESDLLDLKNALDRSPEEREKLFGRKVDTLVVDTVDELQRILLVERLASERRSEIEIKDWGWISDRLHAIFSGLCQLQMNIIFITHTKEVTVAESTYIKPAIAGSFCEAIHGYVDMSLLMKPVASPANDMDVDQLTFNGMDLNMNLTLNADTSPVLFARPLPEAEWINDKTETLDHSHLVSSALCISMLHGIEDANILPSELHEIDHNAEKVAVSEEVKVEVEAEPIKVKAVKPKATKVAKVAKAAVATEVAEVTEVIVAEDENPDWDGTTDHWDKDKNGDQLTIEDILSTIEEDNPDQSTCSECKVKVTSETWKDLSNMKFGVTLCGACYKLR